MSDGTILKAEKDFTKDADKLIPEAEALAKVRSCDSFDWARYTDWIMPRPMSRALSISCWRWRNKHDRYEL
jgi:hypothetical protein